MTERSGPAGVEGPVAATAGLKEAAVRSSTTDAMRVRFAGIEGIVRIAALDFHSPNASLVTPHGGGPRVWLYICPKLAKF
jgi:hypothetical protein